MNRDIFNTLLQWKASDRRKPLLLKGARQTGKTYALRQFGREQYERFFCFNFEEKPEIADFFQRSLEPARILRNLSLYADRGIRPGKDLIIFDEVQACSSALASLKYFQEEASEYHVAAAGSLLGIKMSKPGTFPVGKVNLLDLRPMTFLEFLDAVGESWYRNLIENAVDFEPFAEPFHNDLIELLRTYYVVGGMPEAVAHYAETKSFEGVRTIHAEILQSYELDFAKHAPASDIPKLSLLWHSIPRHLSQENKRFLFSAVRKGARGRDYENWPARAGPMMLFGEKYPDVVRMVSAGDFSKELCGGTHLTNTALVGIFKIISEESVAAGTRRITALTGRRAMESIRRVRRSSAAPRRPAGPARRTAGAGRDAGQGNPPTAEAGGGGAEGRADRRAPAWRRR